MQPVDLQAAALYTNTTEWKLKWLQLNKLIEMYQIFNPEIPGLEPPNTGISGLRKMPGIGIPSWKSILKQTITQTIKPLIYTNFLAFKW
jgi:hypothetical protein